MRIARLLFLLPPGVHTGPRQRTRHPRPGAPTTEGDRRPGRAGKVLALAAVLTALAPTVWAAPDAGAVRTVRVPDNGIQPQVQTDVRGRAHMIYFNGDPKQGDVFYVRSDDGGSTFTRPLRINSQQRSVIAIGTIRGPRMALGKGGRVHVAWMGSEPAEPKVGGKAAPMLYSRLNDAGDGFEAQRNVIQRYAGLDGGGAVAADAQGDVYVAWHAPERGKAEADRQVWVARSTDEGATFAPEAAAAPPGAGACGCCGMTMAAGLDGRVFILFRSANAMVNRDMYLLASKDRAQTFEVVTVDPWKVGMCVMSTSHLATDGTGVLAVWETRDQIHIARLGQDGAKSAPPGTAPGEGDGRKHPAVAVNRRGDSIVAWAEGTGWNKGGRVAWQVFDKEGKPHAGRAGQAEGLPAWGVPAVFAAPDDTFRVTY